jgi:solute carrier family 25 carnitine/acylcarnitine transporter 20/29
VSVQFGAFHEARRRLEELNQKKYANSALSYTQYFMAGSFAGVTNSVLSNPIEHVRIRLQAQPHGAGRLYSGPIDCIKKLSAHQGFMNGVFRGQAVTILREATAYGSWFMAFEYMMNQDAKRNNVKRDEISALKVATYGGLAGEALWITSYPFDVVKSKMQTDEFGENMKYNSMRDCFKKVYAAEGFGGFWKGIGPTLLRAMPVSAGTFVVYVFTARLLWTIANPEQCRACHEGSWIDFLFAVYMMCSLSLGFYDIQHPAHGFRRELHKNCNSFPEVTQVCTYSRIDLPQFIITYTILITIIHFTWLVRNHQRNPAMLWGSRIDSDLENPTLKRTAPAQTIADPLAHRTTPRMVM